MEVEIKKVDEFSDELAHALRRLAQQEGNNFKELTDDDCRQMISSPNTSIFVAIIEGGIIGMVTLMVYRIPYVKKAYMEDLVVNESARGKGIGTLLIKRVMEEAKEKGASYLDFTSRPRREGENAFYEKLGFQQRETNVYRHIIDYNEV